MLAVVKISYGSGNPVLKLASAEGFKYLELGKGKNLEYEMINERRCTGFHEDRGDHRPCPEFREIETGDQCRECRGKDIYAGWRQGKSSPGFDSDYSVYIVQSGEAVKVGVTRTERLKYRWLEQGADYAAEIEGGLSGDKALEIENQISEKGVSETIRKENKVGKPDIEKIKTVLDRLNYNTEVEKIAEPLPQLKILRKGILPSPIETVKGQIVSNGRFGMAMTSGKVLKNPTQRGLAEF